MGRRHFREARRGIVWGALALLLSAAAAQAPEPGTLIVWLVSPARGQAPAIPLRRAGVTLPTTVQTQTAGTFGQTAGSYGQTSSSTGQTVGSFEQTAGLTGQTAGSTGQTAGSFGRTAGSVGRNAGDAGRTMGEFGVSTTGLADAAAGANGSLTAVPPPDGVHDPRWDTLLSRFEQKLLIHLRVVDVDGRQLQARLDATAGTVYAPDVLLGRPLPTAWSRVGSEIAQRYGVRPVWEPAWTQMEEGAGPRNYTSQTNLVVLAGSTHTELARDLAVYIADDGTAPPLDETRQGEGAVVAEVAQRAARSLLQGGSIGGDADSEIANFDGAALAASLTGGRGFAGGEIIVKTEVASMVMHRGLAFAQVRAVGGGEHAFGIAHALLVLRRDDTGRWRVLQASPNLAMDSYSRSWQVLTRYASGSSRAGEEGSSALRNEGTRVRGVSLAAPADGDTRPPQPELWWDNRGGATLQVVEWQQRAGGKSEAIGWEGSNLFFVPDNNSRLRTRVTASFAVAPSQYRWRVWSVGTEGKVVLSGWRGLTISGR